MRTEQPRPDGPLCERFEELEITQEAIIRHSLRVGSGTAGEGLNKVQIDLIAGGKETPLGDAYALQLTYPLHGREALTTILEPALTVRPATLILPTLPQRNLRQANMIYGPTQAVKEGLCMMGLPIGDSRHPIMSGGGFKREDRKELRLQLEALGKLAPAILRYDLGNRQVETQVAATPQTPRSISGFTLKVGEGFAGPPFQELAHVDLMLGLKDGPVGRAIERSLAGWGEERGLRIINERPRALLVPTVTIRTAKQRRLFYEHAAEGVKLAIRLSIEDGFLPQAILDNVVLIANVFVHPSASIARRVEFNNCKATRHAIRKALEGRPTVEELINEKAAARHPFRYAP